MPDSSKRYSALWVAVAILVGAFCQQAGAQHGDTPEDKSPWVITPLISANPKFGSSIGAMVGYLHHFDKASPPSMFGVKGDYSNTDSWSVAAFANTYFDEDKQRLLAVLVNGYVENEYEDFLGSGELIQTEDNFHLFFTRYLYRVSGNWFVGLQGVSTNFSSSSDDPGISDILDLLGLSGHESNALGIAALHDTRDNTNSASSGHHFIVHNFAYREWLGGEESFDALLAEYNTFLPLIGEQVTAVQFKGRFTFGAPQSGYSSIELPAYTRGEYLAEHMSHILVDQRIPLSTRWGVTVSAGAGCLYGDDVFGRSQDCFESSNLYPSLATGLSYTIKPVEKMVVRAQVAAGKSGNKAFYLNFGQPF